MAVFILSAVYNEVYFSVKVQEKTTTGEKHSCAHLFAQVAGFPVPL